MTTERDTKYLMEELGADCERCHAELVGALDRGRTEEDGSVTANYEFHARQLIRSIFAYIEAVTFSVKISSLVTCTRLGIKHSPQEQAFAADMDHELNERGEVVENAAKLSLARNVRFAINLNRRAHRIAEPFDASVAWWSSLREAIRVRDRLTHPKLPEDIDVSGDDILKALAARIGFETELTSWHKTDTGRDEGKTEVAGPIVIYNDSR